jgi:hypothetical protein
MENTKPLYHYTSQTGLLGILGIHPKGAKPCLWMTNILYLNDSSEFIHIQGLVKSELQNRNYRLSIGSSAYRGHQQWEEMNINERKNQVYEDLQNYYDPLASKKENTDIYIFTFPKKR